MTSLRLDHLAVSARTLEEGVAWVESALGLPMAGGGKHAAMSTHNRLLSLGDLYLEVIAVDPEAPDPGRARWFDLDHFSGPPRLTNWAVACDDLEAALALCPPGCGRPMSLDRGDFRWQMAVPDDGILPYDGIFPALIRWLGPAHPAPRLPDIDARLVRLTLTHPKAADLGLYPLPDDPRVRIETGATPGIHATIQTPYGERTLA